MFGWINALQRQTGVAVRSHRQSSTPEPEKHRKCIGCQDNHKRLFSHGRTHDPLGVKIFDRCLTQLKCNFYFNLRKMSLDDPRVEYLRDRVCACFDLDSHSYFEHLLSRGNGEDAQKINQFLNEITGEEEVSALLFFKCTREEEVEYEVPVGT